MKSGEVISYAEFDADSIAGQIALIRDELKHLELVKVWRPHKVATVFWGQLLFF